MSAGSAVAVLAASTAWVVSAGAAPGCTVLQVRNAGPARTSVLYRVSLPAAESVRLGALDHRLNALGYARSQGLVYGMAASGPSGPFPDGAHVVTLDRSGRTHDLGPVRAGRADTPWHPLAAPTAGAVKGNRWYVRQGSYLYAVDVDPTRPTYLSVLAMTAIRSPHWPFGLGDFDVDPVDGELYGVSMTHRGTAAIARLDRVGGRVTELADAPGLPPSTYGSVTIGPDRALYVTADEAGGLYRVGRDGSVEKLAALPPMLGSDASGCLGSVPSPPPPPPPSPPLPPTTTPPPSTTAPTTPSTTRPTPSPASAPPSRRPTSPSRTVPLPPPLLPPPEPGGYAPATPERGGGTVGHDTEEKRRWALAALLLLIGGSAAVRRLR
ncbi:hypothetical protein SAMN05216215_102629 [Saccharopolyspora shandongensis]|uniref:DUF6923 domain-containing protein n=1 Tax=Saccharopolyspora shandongensis TaxID=418495 RepID=A0A1H3JLA9_9PSEU|nr:hypothetical protein [Saccharopolyspora shandongensis]SDY40677.1 hypothetical protein SAMN05216215_102629 [Saccharopolyspora shandongensis]